MRHLERGEGRWCDADTFSDHDDTDDPLESDCPSCLRSAAEFGAKAAVRCMAVENAGAVADSELEAERDAAIEYAHVAHRALQARGLFICHECGNTRSRASQVGFSTPGNPATIWCTDCNSKGVPL